MIVVCDLDDTLYPEITFVHSGFRAVACFLENEYGLDKQQSFNDMLFILNQHGRGAIFDMLLNKNKIFSNTLQKKCIQNYRQHSPSIALYEEAKVFLEQYSKKPLYLVTDGNKNVQANKIMSLGINHFFKKVFITHRYGVHNAKPSTYCFDLIRKKENVNWNQIVYIGDNPKKDFVNLNKVGAITIRVLTGMYKDEVAQDGYDAKFCINSIRCVNKILQ